MKIKNLDELIGQRVVVTAGYLIARPLDWLADRTVRPFARWILSDEIDFIEDDE